MREEHEDRLRVLAFVHLRNIIGSTGAGRVARCLVEELSARPGIDLRLLADRTDYERTITEAGPPWSQYSACLFAHDTSLQQAQWLMLQRPTAEHFWSSAQVTYCTGEAFVPVTKSKLVVTLHDAAHLEPEALPRSLGTLKHRLKWRFLYGVLERKADAFHTVSQFSADRIAHYWPAFRDRLHVVPNGVAECFFSHPPQAARNSIETAGLAHRRFVLLPCGLHHRKNADLILKAWPLLHKMDPTLKLVITSSSHPAYLAQANALGESVTMLGRVSDGVLNALYRAAAVVWFPSLYEGFGMPVAEAMACGAAVLSSNTTSIPEVAGDAALLVSPRSLSEQLAGMEALLTNERMAQSYRERGTLRAKQFRWKRAAEHMHSLFRSLTGVESARSEHSLRA